MIEEVVMRQDIPLDDFLPIFVSSALVLVFGGVYVGIYTAVKTNHRLFPGRHLPPVRR